MRHHIFGTTQWCFSLSFLCQSFGALAVLLSKTQNVVLQLLLSHLFFTLPGCISTDYYVFHGIHEHDWYLIDRIFISFFIYGVYGILAWQFRDYYDSFVTKFWWLILMVFIGCFIWTNIELQNFGHPINFNNAPYYKLSMTLYCLAVIALVSAFCLHQVRKNSQTSLKVFHFLAVYAYRAYLSNVFWNQLVWRGLNMEYHAEFHPILTLFGTWILTWILSFSSAYLLHVWWTKAKQLL